MREKLPKAEIAPKTRDELWAEKFKAKANGVGLYVECDSMNLDETTTYYAIVLPQTEYDDLLRKKNDVMLDLRARYPEEFRASVYEPDDMLDWDTLATHVRFSGGNPSRQSALLNSAQPYIKSKPPEVA